jgi:hypothetical protein
MKKSETKTRDLCPKAELHLGDILKEMNLRARQYHKGNDMTVKAAQQQVFQDFRQYNQDGTIVAIKITAKRTDTSEFFQRVEV